MIKFFKKTRLDSMETNKTGKYIKYAIGEVLLVVIGILIALQLNTWNENQKATKKEIKILKELKNDLETNLKEVKETYTITHGRQLATVLILDYFEKAHAFDDSLKKAFEIIQMDGLFNTANAAYKFIENQGIEILSNDSLRIKTTQMFERHFKNIQNRELKNYDMVQQQLLPLMRDHFISTPTVDGTVSFSEYVINTPKDLKRIRTNSTFKNVIVELQIWFSVRLHWQQETLTALEQLIVDVQIEIDSLSD